MVKCDKIHKSGIYIAWKRLCIVKYPVKCIRTHIKAVLTRGSVSAVKCDTCTAKTGTYIARKHLCVAKFEKIHIKVVHTT